MQIKNFHQEFTMCQENVSFIGDLIQRRGNIIEHNKFNSLTDKGIHGKQIHCLSARHTFHCKNRNFTFHLASHIFLKVRICC